MGPQKVCPRRKRHSDFRGRAVREDSGKMRLSYIRTVVGMAVPFSEKGGDYTKNYPWYVGAEDPRFALLTWPSARSTHTAFHKHGL